VRQRHHDRERCISTTLTVNAIRRVRHFARSTFILSMVLTLSYMNYRGLTVVGHSLVISTLFIIVPFLLLTCIAIPRIRQVGQVADACA